MTDHERRADRQNPQENIERAWKIATRPAEFPKRQRRRLLGRGINQYQSRGTIDEAALLKDVGEFVLEAIKEKQLSTISGEDHSVATQPGKLALCMAVGSILVRQHSIIKNDPRKPRIHKLIRKHYVKLILTGASESQPQIEETIRQEIGELVYSRRQQDDYGPPVGRPVEGVVEVDNTQYYQIPLIHANRLCEGRVEDDHTSAMQAYIEGKYVYLPVQDATDTYENKVTERGGVAETLESVVIRTIGNGDASDKDGKLAAWQEALGSVNAKIEQIHKQNHDEKLFKQSRYPPKLKAILMSVDSVDNEIAKIGRSTTAKSIYTALQTHATNTDTRWISSIAEKIDSPRVIGNVLASYASDESQSHVEIQRRQNDPSLYTLEYQIGNAKQIDVEGIEDLLAFPCMESLHKSLLESKPVRWELYTFVRYLLEVDEASITPDEIKSWFSQYPWYRKAVTEYQVNYERDQRLADNEPPLPISCNNDNRSWAEHCIGKENCDYSLYRSVELNPDVYERLK